MPTPAYERYRELLEEQLRVDVELLYEGYRAKLRAFEAVERARGEGGSSLLPPFPSLTASLPPAPDLSPLPPRPVPAALALASGQPSEPAPAPSPRPRAGTN